MKPINLKISGLNSYIDEQEIDFESLCSKGLFGIFGPTGCGKSTILDGITIALYGANGMARDTKDFINTEANKAVIKYVFSLKSKDGTRVYDISRSFKNSKTGVSNDMAKLVVTELNGEIIDVFDKAKEVNSYLEDLLGLTASDFMRSVVLPQGKFSEFLKLKDADRRRMIERLLNLQEFGIKLADKIKKHKESIKSRLENLEGNISALSHDQESSKDVEEEVKSLEETLGLRDKEYKEFSLYLDEIKDLYKKTKSLYELKDKLSLLDEKSDHIKALKASIDRAGEATKILPIHMELREEKNNFSKLQANYDLKKESFTKLDKENKDLYEIYNKKSIEKEDTLPSLINLEANLSVANRLSEDNSKNILMRDQLRAEFKALKETYKKLSDDFDESTRISEEANKEISKLEILQEEKYISPSYKTKAIEISGKNTEYNKEVKNLEVFVKNKGLLQQAIDADRIKLESLKTSINRITDKHKSSKASFEKATKELENLGKEIHELDKNIINLSNENIIYKDKLEVKIRLELEKDELLKEKLKLENKSKNYGDELSSMDKTLKSLQEKQKKIRINLMLNDLSSELESGHDCPLCGSKEHPHIHKVVDESHNYEQDIEELNKEIEQMKNKHVSNHKDLEFNSGKLNEVETKLLDLKNIDQDDYKKRQAKEDESTNKLEALKKQMDSLEKEKNLLNEGLEKSEKDLESRKEELNLVNSAIEKSTVQLEECMKRISDSERLIEINKRVIEDFLLESKFESLDQILADISSREKELLEADKKLKINRELINKNQDILRQLQIDKDKLYKEMTSIEEKGSSLSEAIKINQGKILEITEHNPGEELEKTRKNIEKIKGDFIRAKKDYEKINEAFIKIEKEMSSLKSELGFSKERCINLGKKEGDLITKSIFADTEEFEASIIGEEELKTRIEEVKKFDEEYLHIKANLSSLEAELKDKRCSQEKYDELILKDQENRKLIDELKEKITVRKAKLKQLKKNEESLKLILKERNQLLDKQGTVNEIGRLTNGNKFVEFVAFNHLSYIASDASTRLMDITNGRYSLELDNNGAFIISDNYNGGVKRSCQSLSGGETFMTSLSLALALSTHIQLKGSSTLEFFILDEGFGTLDVDLLDIVMNSLEKLRTKNIAVGVISHVEELKNRVPMRLNVRPAEAGLHGTKVKIEAN